MSSITINFQEVAITATRRWRDENGKRRQETRKFYQTLNPYNRNPDGTPKSREEIWREINTERDEWLKSHA